MDPGAFDRLGKRLASRRAALRGGLGFAALASVFRFGRAAAQGSPVAGSGTTASDNSTLFVQTATGGTFLPNPAAAMPAATGTPGAIPSPTHLLTLTGHSGETIFFSDRPQRQFGEVKTQRFFGSMGFTQVNPPNAALVADTPQGEDEVVLLELMTPAYDAATHTLTYEANLLQQYRGEELKPLAAKRRDQGIVGSFGGASLFIDDCPAITECGYYVVYQYFEVGAIPGGPFAMCWEVNSGSCVPCLSSVSMQGLTQICNLAYPKLCGGTCVPA